MTDVIERLLCDHNTDETTFIETDTVLMNMEPYTIRVTLPDTVNVMIGIPETMTDSTLHTYYSFGKMLRYDEYIIIPVYIGGLKYGEEKMISMGGGCDFYYRVTGKRKFKHIGRKEWGI